MICPGRYIYIYILKLLKIVISISYTSKYYVEECFHIFKTDKIIISKN